MKTKRIIEQILTFGLAGRMGHDNHCGYVRVAAGDPSKVVMDIDPAVQLSENFNIDGRQLKLSDYVVFEVAGKSMEPQGIANGDFLLAKEIDKTESIHLNDYIIIEVDTEKIDDSECDYKLRRALATINPSDDVDLVMESLKKQGHHQLLLDKYQQMFQEKYNKARSQYKEDILVASITYRDGEMKYSFHSRRFVKFRAEIKARIDMADTVAFDFGMLYLDRRSKLMMIQDSWIDLLRKFFPDTLKEASRQLQRCRNTMSDDIIVQRDDLKRMKEVFSKRYIKEEVSRFLPGLGFSSGCFGLFLLLWLPLCAKGWDKYQIDILAVSMQATLFAQVLYVIAYFCSKPVRETLLGILLPIAFVAIYILIFSWTGILWRCCTSDIIFYCSLCVPLIPIVTYVILLLPMIQERRHKAKKIREETAILKQMLDNKN